MSRKHSRSISTSARRPLDVRFYDRYKHQDTGLTWMWHHITWFLGIMGSVWILRLLIITFLRQCALVSEEETTKLENPRIYRIEQHLTILTMKALIIFILIVVIQCLTGKFNMDMSFLCWEYPPHVVLWNNRAFWRRTLLWGNWRPQNPQIPIF